MKLKMNDAEDFFDDHYSSDRPLYIPNDLLVMHMEDGEYHCLTGPALKYKSGREEYYIEGTKYTKEKFNEELVRRELKPLGLDGLI